jgi:hypothetical protein
MYASETIAAVVLGAGIALIHLSGQTPQATAEKQLMIQTLRNLSAEMADLGAGADNELMWFRGAAENWQPKREDDGQGLRQSLQLMIREIRRARKEGRPVGSLSAVVEDLRIKSEHCQQFGLGAETNVEVRTKRQGLHEVPGLEVWYLEKFLAQDTDAHPHRFRKFSSPVNDTIVPGVYLFWAKNPLNNQAGEKREQRVSGSAKSGQLLTIELLAP